MRCLLILALIASPAFATNKKPPPLPPAEAAANATATSTAQQGQLQGQAQKQEQSQVQTATGGKGYGGKQSQTAKGGNAYSEGSSAKQSQQAIASSAMESGAVSIEETQSIDIVTNTEAKRNAPPVTVMPSPGTAQFMYCFGLGGSSTNGAATGAWCRLQRELYSTHMADYFANMGDFSSAAIAYCSRKLHYRNFNGPGPGEMTCRDQMTDNYRYRHTSMTKQEHDKIVQTAVDEEALLCDERTRRCEAAAIK